jgi:hypothetical protein
MGREVMWVSLGGEGKEWLEQQVVHLAHQSVREVDPLGRVQVVQEWSVGLASVLLESQRIQRGEVLVAAPRGVSPEVLANATSEIRKEGKDATLKRFFGLERPERSDETSYCLVPSNSWNASDVEYVHSMYNESDPVDVTTGGEAIYGLLSLLGSYEEMEAIFSWTMSALSLSPPSVALSGDGAFQAACTELHRIGAASDTMINALASTVTRVVVKGHVCGDYLIWVAGE